MNAYLGIDVSKGYADFVLLDESKNELDAPFQLDDTPQGHQSLGQWMENIINDCVLNQVYAAVESTGGFENNWFSLLIRLGQNLPVKISRLNPSVIKNAALADLKGQVTDSQSARNIATYLIRYSEQVRYQEPDNQYRSYRSLHNHIRLLTKQNTQMINELKQLLYSCFPELQRYCKQSIPHWVLTLLIQYPTAPKLARGKATKVARIKGVSLTKAHQLIERAKKSVSSRGQFTDTYLIQSMAQDIQAKQDRLVQLKALLRENCKGHEVDLLQSMKGIGAYSAACIMIQVEDIARFPTAKHLAGYFGLYPTIKESGDKKYTSRMSKKGRSAIRATLFMCANTAVLYDPHLKNIYARHRTKGKSHKQALGAVMHKMLRIIWGILQSGKAYEPAIDQQNIAIHTPKPITSQKETQEKRRIQEFDADAPVSRMTYRKRKAHQMSQVSNAEPMRDRNDAPLKQT